MHVKKQLVNIYKQEKPKGIFKYFVPFPHDTIKDVTVQCLDNFQGEENKVTIISITRSSGIGFVKTINKILVTLSRARNILCVIGNENLLRSRSSGIWPSIISYLEQSSPFIVAHGIYITGCEHNQEIKPLKTTNDLLRFRFGSCKKYVVPSTHTVPFSILALAQGFRGHISFSRKRENALVCEKG